MGTYFNIRKFHKLPKYIQWIQAILLCIWGLVISLVLLISVEFPLQILLVPIIKPIGHFCLAPLLKLCRVLKYQSPMLITVKNSSDEFGIHNGNTFDYFTRMKWKQKGNPARQKMMYYYLAGLLQIIAKIEKGDISKRAYFTGISYFFSKQTAEKMGFKFERVRNIHKFLFLLDYINLLLMYSFSKGGIAFPNLFRLKKIKISGEDLLNSKTKIISLLKALNGRKKLRTA